jgi:hypothetical protein
VGKFRNCHRHPIEQLTDAAKWVEWVAQKQTEWYRYAITSLTANFSAATVGRAIRIIATVSGPNPPGVVSFYNRGVLLGTAPVINGRPC